MMSSDYSSGTSEPENSKGRKLSKVDSQAQDHAPGNEQQAHDEPDVPSKKSLLAKLDHLAGCVAIGVLPAPRANSMRGIYATMLDNLDDESAVGAGVLSDDYVLKTLRENPAMLKLIKPMLTKEQIALVLREATND
jgi:hypothetical protein